MTIQDEIYQRLTNEEKLFVVDPEKMQDGPSEEELEELDHADAFLVGGSENVTEEATVKNERILQEEFPYRHVYQEPGAPEQVSKDTIESSDGLLVSMPLNGEGSPIEEQVKFLNKMDEKARNKVPSPISLVTDRGEKKADRKLNDFLHQYWIPQAYLIMNADCDAAEVAGVTENDIPDSQEVRAYARIAENSLFSPILYMEGSGEYIEPKLVEQASEQLEYTHLRYGGGIRTYEQVEEMLEAGADSVVVGTSFENGRNPFNPE